MNDAKSCALYKVSILSYKFDNEAPLKSNLEICVSLVQAEATVLPKLSLWLEELCLMKTICHDDLPVANRADLMSPLLSDLDRTEYASPSANIIDLFKRKFPLPG
jgi:hypothetical protein